MYYGDVDSLLIEERNTLRAYRADDAGFELLHERPVPRANYLSPVIRCPTVLQVNVKHPVRRRK